MNQDFYLNRTLHHNDMRYDENELLAAKKYIVVLAEPGAGKTALLNSLAAKLTTQVITANVFAYKPMSEKGQPLVIDAFDEMAKIGEDAIYKLLAKIADAEPTHIIVASRSSEWSESVTHHFVDSIKHKPTVVRLEEFTKAEQQAIYTNHSNSDNFADFYDEIEKFSLLPLLPNPLFLKLFADAYIESNSHFKDRRSIFSDAVIHAAREVNPKIKPNLTLSSEDKVNLCAELFAKLLLAGAEGVQIGEVDESEVYPCITSLTDASEDDLSLILATRLFKPSDNENQHRPVHKIIAEYCAADFIVKRIQAPLNDLTLSHILPVIAPNTVVRDDLRGLLGWMAALGNKEMQQVAIELDAYAVLANGDPSQLEPSSKRLLLTQLVELEKVDPYFRRSDAWRSFNVIGLFSQDIIDDIRTIIRNCGAGHLRDLILELLADAPAIKWLEKELTSLVLNANNEKRSRQLANQCLLSLQWPEYSAVYEQLLKDGSLTSLRLATYASEHFGIEVLSQTDIEMFCCKCAALYDINTDVIGERYFIKRFISLLKVDATANLLDALTGDLTCICNKEYYECDCRIGISKMVGGLLDHYFDNAKPPYDPIRVWQWVGNLYFRSDQGSGGFVSVKVINEHKVLREGILRHVLGQLKDTDKICQFRARFNNLHTHGSLGLYPEDIEFLVKLAFEIDNLELWANFIESHLYFNRKQNGHRDKLRACMRKQANEKPEFMAEWVKQERYSKQQAIVNDKKYNAKYRRTNRRKEKQVIATNLRNIQYVNDNRDLIESGKHWNCLTKFAKLVLFKPENIVAQCGDEQLVHNALKNCLDFIETNVPGMKSLVELKCESNRVWNIEMILVAASIEIMRDKGHLNDLKQIFLAPLKIYVKSGYRAISSEEIAKVKLEVNRRLFTDENSREQFIRQYIEPQLQSDKCDHPDIHMLASDEVFTDLRGKLAIEWISRFDNLKLDTQAQLFDLAVLYADSQALKSFVLKRCANLLAQKHANCDEDLKKLCQYWFFRAFYFLDIDESEDYWRELIKDKDSVILFADLDWRFGRNTKWPQLTARKIEAVLIAYVDEWPKLHLPSMYGNDDPIEQQAYRYLKDIVWSIGSDKPDEAISVLKRLLEDTKLADFHNDFKSQLAEQLRKKALQDFIPPSTEQVTKLIDEQVIATVEGLRQLVLQILIDYQKDITGGEFNEAKRFYNGSTRLGEVDAVEIVAERLNLILKPCSITITPEHQTKNQNRIDITAAKMINGQRKLLVIEAKGQWHKELYTAADTQLYERYAIHPDAEHQGIYLVIWFGKDEKVANRTQHGIENAKQLKKAIEDKLSPEHKNRIDVFVLDVSK